MSTKVRDILGLKAYKEQEQPSPLFCLPKERVGLEYEWENTRTYGRAVRAWDENNTPMPSHIVTTRQYFDTHVDGSLRQDGCEWVFKRGYSGTMIVNAVNAMDETARIGEFKGSYRTSLHVHLNMQDVDFPHDVTRMGAVYCMVEPFLYDFVGEDRDCCNYCTPWAAHPGHFETWFSLLNNTYLKAQAQNNIQTYAGQFKHSKAVKYSGLNFFSLGDFGTVEFRQAPVIMQRDKILVWINLLMRLKKWVIEHPSITSEQLVIKVNSMTPEAFLTEVFDSNYKDVTKRTRDIATSYKRGMSTLYHYISLS